MHIIVDGYNLIRQSDTLRGYERISLEAGRQALLRSLAGYRKLRGHRITVVFDGWVGGSPQEERDRAGGMDIIYSRLGEKADEVIKRLLQKGSEEIMVVTSDREIVNFAARRGKTSIASAAFASLLDGIAAGPVSQGPPERKRRRMKIAAPPRKRRAPPAASPNRNGPPWPGSESSNGRVKSPYAALRFLLRHCGVRDSTPHSSGVARLAF